MSATKTAGVLSALLLVAVAPAAAQEHEVPVDFYGPRDVTVIARRTDGGAARGCAVPCRLSLAPGRFRLSLADARGVRPIDVDELLDVSGPRALRVRRDDHSAVRSGGWVALVTGAALLAIGCAVWAASPPGTGWGSDQLAGLAIMDVGVIALLGSPWLFLFGDGAHAYD